MPSLDAEILRGTLDPLILKSLSWGPTHGYGVARWIERATREALSIEEGTLYPALYRLEERGWIRALESADRRRPYAITGAGKLYLEEQLAALDQVVKTAMRRLNPA